ncbi:glucose PTS transporter transcription antiterminator GlcT [Paenibacillus macquariensis]|uniref:Transcriptional antiterminator, BglG family n=1 Tax=Paenibacillus macquariensis TaxID=948756 RepID=A0ABY1K1T0_9BACL|nr:PRD domain-containing protein [Paenibacillus macquariensis]MEC0091703.1 PRD domain-containing protein [Paenibacillus macquariensis]OAB32371.1 PtsGHI operon antiterminator [Paenibacillus macquariensis subsp. macquariensis]SIR13708.1 transcriptional antiterminator, BglG family [Paenibacillus macquariensis]
MGNIQVFKVLNNNVIIANHPQFQEVVVIGKGIGFNCKVGDDLPLSSVEKMFILTNEQEQEQYKQLIPQVAEHLIEIVNEGILYIKEHSKVPLNEHIHIALTDHISFAIKRYDQGIVLHNPFLFETKEMYPEEYRMAEHVVKLIRKGFKVDLEEDEIGFVALHIHSALTDQHVSEVKKQSELVAYLVEVVEQSMDYHIPRDSLDYSRFITHLRFALERVRSGKVEQEIGSLDKLLYQEYPELYSLAWKMTKIMEEKLRKPVYPSEVSYLTVHLQRLSERKNGTGDKNFV